jgi:hypothetical protein
LDARVQNPADAGIGDLFSELVADGRNLVSAEVNLYKQIARYRVGKAKNGVIALVAGGFLAYAGLIAFLVGVVMGLADLIGPVLGGLPSCSSPGSSHSCCSATARARWLRFGRRGREVRDPGRGEPGMSKAPTQAERDLEEASRQVALAKRRVAAAKGALQYRLKPANLANEAWTSVRSKSELAADEASALPRAIPARSAA